MAGGIEDITPEVTVVGADQAAAALQNIGEVGAKAFADIADAAAKGDYGGLATLVGGELAGAFTSAAEAITELIHGAAEAAEQLDNLSAITGESVSQLEGLGEAFASVGIGTQGFERSMNRLATTISQSWSSIQESVRTSANEQASAQTGVQQAALNTQKAYLALEEASEHAAQTAQHDSEGIVSAQLGLQKAALAQQKGLGVDTSSEDKLLQQQEQANAVVKARQALYDANQKAADDEAKAVDDIKQKQLDLQKAHEAEAEAAEKEYETHLKNLPEIAKEIQSVVDGYTSWKDHADLADVSAQNLTNSIILAASAGGKEPDSAGVLKELSSLFDSTAGHAVDMGTKVEIVTRLMGSGFRAGQASAAQLIAILEKGPEALDAFQKSAENSPFKMNDKDTDAIKDMNAAWAELGATVAMVEEKFAALAAPTLTAIFNAVKAAIEVTGNALKAFGEALDKAFGAGAGDAVARFAAGFAAIYPAVMAITVVLGTIVPIIAGIIAASAPWVVIIGLVGTAIYMLVTHWNDVKEAVKAVGDYIESWVKAATDGIQKVIDKLKEFLGLKGDTKSADQGGPTAQTSSGQQVTNANQKAVDAGNVPLDQGGIQVLGEAADKQTQAAGDQSSAADKQQSAADALSQAAQALAAAAQAQAGQGGNQQQPQVTGQAGGGHIRGPGTGTSDEAGLYALSDGEYVVKSAAVQHYGSSLFDALNNMALGGFATGGRVGGVSVPAPGIGSHGGSSILNLTIDGEKFNGLRAPNDVAAKLKMHAVNRQSAATGRNPSWMR